MKICIWFCILFFMLSPIAIVSAQNFPGGKFVIRQLPSSKFSQISANAPAQIFSDSAHTLWLEKYNDPINGDDEADAMVKDSSGNLYVTGNCSDTGATYGWDITTIKYNSDGVQLWKISFDGPGHGDDVPYDIAVDQNENVYIAGYGQQGVNGTNFLTLKIDSSGVIEWYRLLNNDAGSNDVAFGIAVDNNGNVFATGATFVLSSGSFDLTTVKYNSLGVQQWIQKYNSPFSNEDTGLDLQLDTNDNVYITGVSQEEPGNYDVITMKYNSDGQMEWLQRYNGPGNSNDGGYRLAIDANQNVIITGYQTGAGTLFDILTIKYDSDGNQQWVAVYNGPANSEDDSNDIVLDEAGNVYITGFVTGTNNTSDYATLKYTPDGALMWASFYSGPANGFEQSYGIALDNADGVYVTGYSPSVVVPYVHYEYATIKYDTSGQEQWVSRYSGNSSLTYEPNVAKAIVTDNSGDVYITGKIADEGTGEDFGTIKYTQSVVPVELISFNAEVSGRDVILKWKTGTELNNKGFEIEKEIYSAQSSDSSWENIGFVTGFGTTTEPESYTFTDNNVAAGKYNYRLKQINFSGSYKYSFEVEIEINAPAQFALYQNYPNPFNPSTTITFSLAVDSKVKLDVFDVLGRKIKELVNSNLSAGTHSINFDASGIANGIYFYHIEVTGSKSIIFNSVKKMILLK